MQGRTIELIPRHPADGRMSSLSANTSTSTGAIQYSGIATNAWVIVVMVVSVGLPRRTAATAPSGRARMSASSSATAARLKVTRSEEHTSELQSRFDLVCRLLLEKKKQNTR